MARQVLADAPGILPDLLPRPAGTLPPALRAPRRRVTLYGIADEFDEDKLHSVLRASFSSSAITVYPDVRRAQATAFTQLHSQLVLPLLPLPLT